MKTRLLLLLMMFALVAAACGDSGTTTTTGAPDTSAPAQTTTAPPETTTTAPPETTTTAPPETTTTTTAPAGRTFTGADGVEVEIADTSRIVSLAGDITETLFELGVGDRVVAIDVTTTFPPEATELPVIGFAQQLAPEPVIGLRPTLVLGDEFTAPPEAVEQIRGAGIPMVILPSQTTFEGVVDKITAIAEIVGEEDAGQALAERVQGDIQAAVDAAAAQEADPQVAFVYTRGPQTLLLFGAGMPTQAMIEGAGAVDAAAANGIRGAAPLTPEALVQAAPEVIVLPEAGVQALGGVEAFAAIPGVAETPAGQAGSFLVYDEAYFFNLGPRVGLALQEFVNDLYGS